MTEQDKKTASPERDENGGLASSASYVGREDGSMIIVDGCKSGKKIFKFGNLEEMLMHVIHDVMSRTGIRARITPRSRSRNLWRLRTSC
ncbi:MAG: hypothetical protein LBS77_05885 [Desulfovibrio sp.]|nr:hypothetical protein [Desulfovibrio sp.]